MKSARYLALSFVASLSWSLGVGQAHAQIYKYIDPVTGIVEYTSQPKKGASRMDAVDTLGETPSADRATTLHPREVSALRHKNAPTTTEDFRRRSLELQAGLTSESVEKLLGKPSRTAAKTFGARTKSPWNGIEWRYDSGTGWLSVNFQREKNLLFVNSWNWY